MSSWVERYSQPRPSVARPTVERKKVEGAVCPECGSDDVRRYPVAAVHGPRMATKCQACMHTLALERPSDEDFWPLFRSVTWDWEPSLSERASRDLHDERARNGGSSAR
jgi:hypothetical protein